MRLSNALLSRILLSSHSGIKHACAIGANQSVYARKEFWHVFGPCYSNGHVRHKTKAVIFDMGGVVLSSPFPFTRKYEDERGIPAGTIWKCIADYGKDGSWPKLEVGELDSVEFGEIFSTECSATAGMPLQLYDFLEYIEQGMGDPLPEVFSAIQAIRAEGIKTALLTNNWKRPDGSTIIPVDRKIFDVVVESAVAGINKPNPAIYQKCLNELGVSAEQAVFLDDIETNIKAAKALGIHCIKVENIKIALIELEETVQFPLSGYVEGTRAVRKGMEIPELALIEYIRTIMSGETIDSINIRQFSHGQSNPTYLLQFGQNRLVLRKKPPGKLLPSAHAIEREYKVMKAMAASGVPIPQLVALCEDEPVIGTPFYLMEYLAGNIYKNPLLPTMEKSRKRKIYEGMVDVLCSIHSVDIDDAGLANYGKQGNYVERQVKTWSRQYQASETHTIPAMNRLMEWLPQHLPQEETTTVVHGDFRLDNLIFHPDTDQALGTLDWELSTLGNPLSDVAYMCLLHFLPSETPILPGMKGANLEELGIPSAEDLVTRYCEKMGYDVIENMDFYMAFTFFRVAAILQGVYKRSNQGQASSASARSAGSLAANMANIGWDFATKEGFRIFNQKS